MTLGNWQLDTVSGGRFRLDGGAMFGVVPKPVWEKRQPADARNRIELATNCVLARDGTNTVLIDAGYGGKASERERDQMALEDGEPLVESLSQLKLSPDEITHVVFSHLHFDHAGGGTKRRSDGGIVPTFPNAIYVANQLEWEDATSGRPELRGAYPLENVLPAKEANQLRLVDGNEEIVPGLTARHTGGHTRGHHILVFDSGGEQAIYLGDLCPTHSHMPTLWNMGYDTFPLATRRRKPEILAEIADTSSLILWDHDPLMAAARIERDEKREFVVSEQFVTL